MESLRGRLLVPLAPALVLAAVGAICAAAARHGCLHPPPPVMTPDPGTPRAHLCRTIHGSSPWTLMVGVPAAAAAAIGLASRRLVFEVAFTVLASAALIVVAGLANSMTSAATI